MTKQPSLKLAWRVGLPHYETDEAFEKLLKALRRRPSIVDEVAMFDSITHHLYIPLDVYAQRAALMGRRLRQLKRAGVKSTGINVLATIGHINEGWSYMPPLPFQPMIDQAGTASTGCACPNTAAMRAYTKAKYELAARAKPDFIWVDDDLRMQHHGGHAGGQWNCFCPTCLEIFARTAGRAFSREELVGALNAPEGGHWRRLWVAQNVETIRSLLSDIAQAVHGVSKRIHLGLMTAGAGWTTYSGQAFDQWFPALEATKARPGGGFYDDDTPLGMYAKAIDVGCQRTALPAGVNDIQYELENFPYQALKKAPGTVVNECTLALAAGGLNGIAFNALGVAGEDYGPVLQAIGPVRKAWQRLVAHADALPTAGLWPAWSPKLAALRSVRAGETWLGYGKTHAVTLPWVLGEIGLPLRADAPGCATVLPARVAEAFEDDELRAMLSGGVLMDGESLAVLHQRGLGDLAGVAIASRFDNGMMERFSDDPLNGAEAGSLRDARIEFWGDAHGQADTLEPLEPSVRVLARLEDYFYRDRGPCLTAFENRLGGRVVVMGYAPWMFIHSAAKRRQLQNVADWISRMAMPVRIEPTVKLIPLVRLSADRRRGAIVLLNASVDPVPLAKVHLRVPRTSVRAIWPKGMPRLAATKTADGCCVSLRNVAPWSTTILLVG